jgi:hypothetical protein
MIRTTAGLCSMLDRRMLLMGVLTLAATPALAQDAGPLPLVKRFYAPGFDERTLPMSKSLRRLFAAARARSERDDEPVAGLDFSWTLGAQDAEDGWERTLAYKTLAQTLGNAVIEVRFRNGRPQVLQYRMVREGGRWAVDDIEYLTARRKLSALFERGAKGET